MPRTAKVRWLPFMIAPPTPPIAPNTAPPPAIAAAWSASPPLPARPRPYPTADPAPAPLTTDASGVLPAMSIVFATADARGPSTSCATLAQYGPGDLPAKNSAPRMRMFRPRRDTNSPFFRNPAAVTSAAIPAPTGLPAPTAPAAPMSPPTLATPRPTLSAVPSFDPPTASALMTASPAFSTPFPSVSGNHAPILRIESPTLEIGPALISS